MIKKRITVVEETKTGRNVKFKDNKTKEIMTLPQFIKKIEKGKYEGIHIKERNKVKIPAGNPDGNTKNNLN